ncbi:MAG: PLP-dependent aminotransferase family protein [Nitrososphaerales archaeon]
MNDSEVISLVKRLKKDVASHEKWRAQTTLNLIASENYASQEARSFLSSDLSNRYTARDHFYRGTRFTDEVEDLAVNAAKKLYRAKFADVRPISGHTCSLIVFMSLLNPGDKIVTCPPRFGGYPGSSELGLGPLLHLKNLYFPYDESAMNIIPDETSAMLSKEKPEMTIFGSSFIPFPYKIRDSLPESYEGYRIYDGSHVMGLIAGQEFQDPLREGCSVLMGSTHKSFFGPQGGILLSNDEQVFQKIESKIFPGIVDNIHWNRVASLAYSLLELLKFGKAYARQVVKNSKTLAKTLDELGIPVKSKKQGYTQSHQVLLDYNEADSMETANLLENLNIITDVGIRLGTSEVTRRGMKEKEMEQIANIISDAVNKRVSKEKTRNRVHKIVKNFSSIEYTF